MASGVDDFFKDPDLLTPFQYHSWCENNRVVREDYKNQIVIQDDCAQKPGSSCVEIESKLHNLIIINAECK